MGRNCDLELRLHVASGDDYDDDSDQSKESPSRPPPPQHPQKLAVFYNGQVCVCDDVTEIQARAILMVASREMEEKLRSPKECPPSAAAAATAAILSSSPKILESEIYSPNKMNGLSMKRSLQRFLQKRKTRIQSTSPYNNNTCFSLRC